MRDAGEDGDEELDQFGLGGVGDLLLREGHGLQQRDQAKLLGKVAEQDEEGMIGDGLVSGGEGGQALRGGRRGAGEPRHTVGQWRCDRWQRQRAAKAGWWREGGTSGGAGGRQRCYHRGEPFR